ncbi:Adenylate kinase [Zancudomyces culisetae]|uniref:Adenylate kinase n=1 Tax=Zancudomyces culisetae TaxID=1213189 RepID=A0A1R1PJQ9_ZANCU|nr:Adenylate kinase [Zancudomyces culisetae]|eukprot:OMH81169.1 Adenylate kinase [Zancudomyces culisetae]
MNRGIIITNRQLWNRVTSIQKLGAIAVIGTRTLPCSAARYQSTQSQTQLRCSEQESAEKIQDKPIPTNANPNDSVNVSVQVGHQQYSVTRSGIPIRSLILGAPGSGKGTQTKKLRGDFDLTAISSGDLLRKSISAGNEIGKQVAKLVERGEFVPDELMVQVVQHELGSVINQVSTSIRININKNK